MSYQDAVDNRLMEYLELKKWEYKKSGAVTMVKCPKCGKIPYSAQKIPNVGKVNCFTCAKFTIIDFVKVIEPEFKDKSDEDINKHIRDLFNIPVVTKIEQTDIEKLFDKYYKNGFSLTALCKNSNSIAEGHYGKQPVKGVSDWQKTKHTSIKEWLNWIRLGLNVGLVCGLSKITVLELAVGIGGYSPIIKEHCKDLIINDIREPYVIKLYPSLKFKKFNVMGKYPFKDNSFDFVFCSSLIEHVNMVLSA